MVVSSRLVTVRSVVCGGFHFVSAVGGNLCCSVRCVVIGGFHVVSAVGGKLYSCYIVTDLCPNG